jgi:hypothetical protein
MNETIFVVMYFAYFTACILVAGILFAIIRYRHKKRKSFAFFSFITKLYSLLILVCFGVSIINFNEDSALYIILPAAYVFSFTVILSRMTQVESFFIFMLFWTTGFTCFMQIYYLTHVQDIQSDYTLFEGSIAYINIFCIQSGISFCFIGFAHLGLFTETIRPIVKLKTIKNTETNENRCPICLEQFVNNDNSQVKSDHDVVLTKCNHSFHRQCIEMHCDQTSENIQSTQNHPQCPMCRTELGEQDKVCFC